MLWCCVCAWERYVNIQKVESRYAIFFSPVNWWILFLCQFWHIRFKVTRHLSGVNKNFKKSQTFFWSEITTNWKQNRNFRPKLFWTFSTVDPECYFQEQSEEPLNKTHFWRYFKFDVWQMTSDSKLFLSQTVSQHKRLLTRKCQSKINKFSIQFQLSGGHCFVYFSNELGRRFNVTL